MSPSRQSHLRRRRGLSALLALGILPAVLSGCSGDSDPAPTEDPSVSVPAGAAQITIADFGYEISGTIAPGATISVMNQDNVGHTVTSDEDGVFDVVVGAGESVTFTAPEEPGDYPFHCTPHPAMVSVLTVG